jgi:hypothetical protein
VPGPGPWPGPGPGPGPGPRGGARARCRCVGHRLADERGCADPHPHSHWHRIPIRIRTGIASASACASTSTSTSRDGEHCPDSVSRDPVSREPPKLGSKPARPHARTPARPHARTANSGNTSAGRQMPARLSVPAEPFAARRIWQALARIGKVQQGSRERRGVHATPPDGDEGVEVPCFNGWLARLSSRITRTARGSWLMARCHSLQPAGPQRTCARASETHDDSWNEMLAQGHMMTCKIRCGLSADSHMVCFWIFAKKSITRRCGTTHKCEGVHPPDRPALPALSILSTLFTLSTGGSCAGPWVPGPGSRARGPGSRVRGVGQMPPRTQPESLRHAFVRQMCNR